ncbi:hypothetical protein ACFLUX_00265 [Chloroflexota bacterium]
MDRPGGIEKIRLVAILRTLKNTQDYVAEILKMRKERIVLIENWLGTAFLDEVEGLFVGNRLQKTVDEELAPIEGIDPVEVARAARLVADDVLQHYRSHYPSSVKPLLPTNQIGQQLSEHWARLGRVAEALKIGLEFPKYIESEQVESRYGGAVWGNWVFSMVQFRDSKFVESPEVQFSAEGNNLWDQLMKHIDAEFPGFIAEFNKFKSIAVDIIVKQSSRQADREQPQLRDHPVNRELRQKLWLVIERGTFKGSCDICRD